MKVKCHDLCVYFPFHSSTHRSSSYRLIFSGPLQYSTHDISWIWQTEGRGTSDSLCLQKKSKYETSKMCAKPETALSMVSHDPQWVEAFQFNFFTRSVFLSKTEESVLPPYCPACGEDRDMKECTLWSGRVDRIPRHTRPPETDSDMPSL